MLLQKIVILELVQIGKHIGNYFLNLVQAEPQAQVAHQVQVEALEQAVMVLLIEVRGQ